MGHAKKILKEMHTKQKEEEKEAKKAEKEANSESEENSEREENSESKENLMDVSKSNVDEDIDEEDEDGVENSVKFSAEAVKKMKLKEIKEHLNNLNIDIKGNKSVL